MAEHFARLRYARKHYALQHPMISYHRSQLGRALNLEPSTGEREYYERCEMYEVLVTPRPHWLIDSGGANATLLNMPVAGVSRASDRARIALDPGSLLTASERAQLTSSARSVGQSSPVPPGIAQWLFAPLNMDLRGVDSVAARIGYNLATGLDDRGVMYLRFGPPQRQFVGGRNVADPQCSVPDVERWDYDEYGEARFARPSAFSRGERAVPDMVFRAMNERQFKAVRKGLTEDASSVPAPLEFGIWTAQFAHARQPSLTDVVVVSTRGLVAASLDAASAPGPEGVGPQGIVVLASDSGNRVLVAQANDSGVLGRQTLTIAVRGFSPGPAVSGLLLAPAWEGAARDRAAMLAHVQRTLVFDGGSTIRVFAEVYGLSADSGTVRYETGYELLRSARPERDIALERWPGATVLGFRRERRAASAGPEVETLDIIPAQVPTGKYLLRVRIRDLVAERDAGYGTIAFVVR